MWTSLTLHYSIYVLLPFSIPSSRSLLYSSCEVPFSPCPSSLLITLLYSAHKLDAFYKQGRLCLEIAFMVSQKALCQTHSLSVLLDLGLLNLF